MGLLPMQNFGGKHGLEGSGTQFFSTLFLVIESDRLF
jgi:hypothetical protein